MRALPWTCTPSTSAFLKDDRFLLTSPNAYNALGLGTTQLYNRRVVYNHKRHGKFVRGGRTYDFRVKPHFPRQVVNIDPGIVKKKFSTDSGG